LHSIAEGVDMSEDAQAMGAIREVGPGGHYLGCEHTQNNFKSSFWRSDVLDYKPFETWTEDGEKDTVTLANEKVQKMLSDYIQPPIDPSIDEALKAYMQSRKDSEPDAFG